MDSTEWTGLCLRLWSSLHGQHTAQQDGPTPGPPNARVHAAFPLQGLREMNGHFA